MSKRVLQVNYKIDLSSEEIAAKSIERAEAIISNVSGLEWKMFLVNNVEQEIGGIYLFTDEQSLDNYLDSALFAAVRNNPLVSQVKVKKFNILDQASRITHGPT